ncbi:MAG TPA: hypothetical protein VEX68_15135 [Bryobacteraceae bacterium]|nr:hypothetical protein [Bryobacteraceae bacterium]
MANSFLLPDDFEQNLGIPVKNAHERLAEAREIGSKLAEGGIHLKANPDHFAMFTDPPRLLNGPLKRIGYIAGADNRCYPSPVDGCDYINVAASLPPHSHLRKQGWPEHVAVVHPVDDAACARMFEQGYGNPFIHHITFGIAPSESDEPGGIGVAERMIRQMSAVYHRIPVLLGQSPGTLIMALPAEVLSAPEFSRNFGEWTGNLSPEQYQLQEMEGSGYLLQFFVFRGGKIEVALRHHTRQTFNPKSVHKISADELSVDQGAAIAEAN